MLLGEYGHLVTMGSEFTGELAESNVVAVWSGTGARAQRGRVLSYQGDLHLWGLLADEPQSRCRQRKRKKSGTSSARPAKTPCRVERACVVGTTEEKHIPLREFSNNPVRGRVFSSSARCGGRHAVEDRDQAVGGGQPQDLGHRGLRGHQGEDAALPGQ